MVFLDHPLSLSTTAGKGGVTLAHLAHALPLGAKRKSICWCLHGICTHCVCYEPGTGQCSLPHWEGVSGAGAVWGHPLAALCEPWHVMGLGFSCSWTPTSSSGAALPTPPGSCLPAWQGHGCHRTTRQAAVSIGGH